MLENLLEIDRSVFLFFNRPHSLYWDQVMWVYTGRIIWIPLMLAMGCILFRKNGKEGLLTLLMIALVITISDQIASTLFKPMFQRLRPTQEPGFAHLVTIINGYRGGRYGFASSHAANAFGVAIFTILLFRRRFYTVAALVWALTMCYSRMYVGVHYPGDLAAGALIGTGAAVLVYHLLYIPLYGWLYRKGICPYPAPGYAGDKDAARYAAVAICVMFVIILLFSPLFNFSVH
ncbi:MAG: phosphatase PAP2 family protein [Coprobacter sp.]|nr:phosphatase PAP2 family protein [Coprobacter sp.]